MPDSSSVYWNGYFGKAKEVGNIHWVGLTTGGSQEWPPSYDSRGHYSDYYSLNHWTLKDF